jgi:hypothetical protein
MTRFLNTNQKYSLTNTGAPLREATLVLLDNAHFTQIDFNAELYTFTILTALGQMLQEIRTKGDEEAVTTLSLCPAL